MRVLSIWLITIIAFVAGGTTAFAQGFYVGGQLGAGAGGGDDVSFGADLVLDTGPFVDLFVGKSFGNVRIEGEYAFRQNDMDTWNSIPIPGEMMSHALMGNLYYDFGTASGIRPYVGAGLGFADVTLDSTFYATNDSDTTFALQVMGGVAFPMSGNLMMTLDLRVITASPRFVDGFGFSYEQEYTIGSFAIGLRTTF